MANLTPPCPTNLLDYIPGKHALSPEAWKANAALKVYKLLKNLKQAAKLYPLLDPKTPGRFLADWPLVEDYLARSAMDTYPGGQGAANVAVRKNVNDLLHTYFIKLLTPYWPRIEKALNVLEYDDDASLLHVRNAHVAIMERMPLVPLLITKLEEKTYKVKDDHRPRRPQQEPRGPHPGFQRPQRCVGPRARYYHRLARQHRHALVHAPSIS
jgi:hypothetical protein